MLELSRYFHLNPSRVGMVGDLNELNDYHWARHYAIMGRVRRDRQDIAMVLAYFGKGRNATPVPRFLVTLG